MHRDRDSNSGQTVDLESGIRRSLDRLLGDMALQPVGADLFRITPGADQLFDRVYGGQLLAQALAAATMTVPDKAPHSLHAAFVAAATPGAPLDLAVERVRDGRSTATRRVTILEQDRTILSALASFHANTVAPDVADPAPAVPEPEHTPSIQQWAEQLPDPWREHGRRWIEQPPPVEIRIAEAPTFLGGSPAEGTRSHWMRLPADVGGDPSLHAALLVYASDFFLMDIVFRAHPDGPGPGRFTGYSLDHAIWLHRPTRFDRWHLHTQQFLTLVGERGLARGAIHDADGRLVATTMQEVLVRPMRQR